MSKFINGLSIVALTSASLFAIGCSETEGTKQTIEATSPEGGKTTVTKEIEVEKSGENPPAVIPETKPAP